MRVLLLGKKREDPFFQRALDFSSANLPDLKIILAEPGQNLPQEVRDWQGDLLISYLCPWVIPADVLKNARFASINFHPAPPEFPGTGCTNFAIYQEVTSYGVTCHHMAEVVDSGAIIAVRRFDVTPQDTVYSLTQRCYAYMLVLYFDIISMLLRGEPLPQSPETWTRKAYRRKELNDLKRLTLDMPMDEIRRRVKASAYPGTPGAYFVIDGLRFEYHPD